MFFEQASVGRTYVLHATIRMVDEAWLYRAAAERLSQRLKSQLAIEAASQGPAHDAPATGIEHNGCIKENGPDTAPRETLRVDHTIQVPEHLRAPHPLITRTRENPKEARLNHYQRINSAGIGALDISVATSSVNRALRILDTLVKEAERLGIKVDVQSRKSYLVIRREQVRFALSEKLRREKHQPTDRRRFFEPEWDYFPTGILRMEIRDTIGYYGRKLWQDTAKQKLEDLIGPFLSGAFDAALASQERRQQWEEQEKRRQEEARRRQELERLRQLEEVRRKDLEDQAVRFNKAQILRAYIAEVERRASVLSLTDDQCRDQSAWVTWAHEHADRLDPLTRGLPFERFATGGSSPQPRESGELGTLAHQHTFPLP